MAPLATSSGVDPEWLDQMMTKLQHELERQLNRVSQAKAEDDSARTRAADARTLDALERTLERLARLERERAAVKEKKIARHGADKDGAARTALERRLDKRLAAAAKGGAAGKPDG